jgi:hypothetical protein
MTGSPSRIPRRRRRCLPADSARPAAAAVAPEPSPARPCRARLVAGACGALLVLSLIGCTETGDFGRPKPSFLNDVALPATGAFAAVARGEPVSPYVLTDDESELRDRAWRFVMPAHERAWFESILANLVRTRVLPASLQPADRTAYHRALMGDSFRSPASRYRRLSEDAVADLKLIGPLAAMAARVIAADRARLRGLAYVHALHDDDAHDAAARVAENRCLIAWVRHETLVRLESYRFALEHLFIEAPQNEAVGAERSLAQLAAHRRTLDALAGPAPERLCAGEPTYTESAAVIASGDAPLVVKD